MDFGASVATRGEQHTEQNRLFQAVCGDHMIERGDLDADLLSSRARPVGKDRANGQENLVYNKAETQSMPIFEYTCQSCNHRFEHLTRADREPVCPACEGHTLNKHLSTFAVGANGSTARADFAAAGSCGSCGDPRGPGACSMN
jgi:putative FmdB family regulatory protein